MRDYWLTQYLLAAVGWGYAFVCAGALALALWLPKGKAAKAIATVVVLGLASILPIQGYQGYRKDKQAAEEFQARYAKAKALFDERCKTAGEKIYRTVEGVEGVEGVLLLNLRPESVRRDDQFERYDPYGYEGGGDQYIKSFLPGRWPTCVGSIPECPAEKRAFNFVEIQSNTAEVKRYKAIDQQTGKPLLPKVTSSTTLIVESMSSRSARYGVRWEDISTDADRQVWIAGGRLTIIDLTTNFVVAERTGFLLDSGQGSTSGFRSPWSWARAYTKGCPSVDGHNFIFVRKILKSIQGE